LLLKPRTGAERAAFGRWPASVAIAIDPDNPYPDLDAGEAIRAMIRVTLRFTDVTEQVASQLR
jgi:hypothetical protein